MYQLSGIDSQCIAVVLKVERSKEDMYCAESSELVSTERAS